VTGEAWALSVADATAALRSRTLSATELVTSVLQRLTDTEPDVHAWAFVDDRRALADARDADDDTAARAVRGPLHGVPFGVKDVIDTAGWPTQGGSRAYAGRIPTQDAATVQQLRLGGAVALGKTVTHELAYGQNTPATLNPRDPERYPGGSSVGSGVAVAVGSAPTALGTDTGGSVRNPAAVNGVVGLRPTSGLVDCRGTMHLSPSLDQIGPISRDVVDCALVLSAMVTPAAWRRLSDRPAEEAMRVPLLAPRLGFDPSSWTAAKVSPQVSRAVVGALEQLQHAGVEVVEVSCPALAASLPLTVVISAVEATEQHLDVLRHHPARLEPATRTMLELGLLASPADRQAALEEARWLRDQVLELMQRHSLTALASPTLPSVAPVLESFATDLTRDAGAQDLSGALNLLAGANLCGLPGLSVPCGDVADAPVGLHLLGTPQSDLDLLRVGRLHEQLQPARGLVDPVSLSARTR
jgi:Asp-tRNA(Asn)/Glu-tRNA(Gln) amidotransferase A subunit family amidase